MSDTFNFSAQPQVFGPFAIGSDQYVLREASEDAHIAYRDVSMRAMSLSGDSSSQKARIEGGAEADAVLVSKCLFKLDPTVLLNDKPTERPVTVQFVRTLPRRIVSKLYNKVRELSGMDEDEETEQFLTARIESDRKKLAALRKDGTPGNDEPGSTPSTSG